MFQEKIGDVFDPVRERIRYNRGIIRKKGADYLLYSLIDALVDDYFVLLEKIGDEIDVLEEEVLERPEKRQFRGYINSREIWLN